MSLEAKDPELIGRVIVTRHGFVLARRAVRRSLENMEDAFTAATEGRVTPREFGEHARHACDAADAYRSAVRAHAAAMLARLTQSTAP